MHLFLLRNGRHHSPHFQAAWNKYGEQSFVFEVLAEVTCDFEFELRDVETGYLTEFARALYNAAPEGKSVLNMKRSDETRAKISAALRGRKRSAETRARIADAQRKRSPSTRNLAPLFASRRGVRLTSEHRAKIGESNRRRVLSEETRLKLRAAYLRARALYPDRFRGQRGQKGHQHTLEAKQKISAALRGKAKHPEAILKQAASLSRRPNGAIVRSPEGVLHRVVNVSAFAREHGLDQRSLSAVILSKRRIHKGWTLAETLDPPNMN